MRFEQLGASVLEQGLYEQIINKAIKRELKRSTWDDAVVKTGGIDKAEASKVIADYVAGAVKQALDAIEETGGDSSLESQIELANRVISLVGGGSKVTEDAKIEEPGEQLLALIGKKNTAYAVNAKKQISRPETSIAQSSLFTGGASHEPQMLTELQKEIESSDRIDMLVSFIKWSGYRQIQKQLEEFSQRGGKLRVITTPYIGATDPKALDAISQLKGAEVKVSYDTKSARLHAKTYVFYRKTGFTTAYVGSSNLSKPALTSGCEWNMKVTKQDLPEVVAKIESTFESYWASQDFEAYDPSQRERFEAALTSERRGSGDSAATDRVAYNFAIRPYAFQQAILDRLRAEREVRGHWRNLVVAATGTGKTVISAFDYQDFCKRYNGGRPARLLFVAHREEILKQSQACFAGVLKDPDFGDLFVGGRVPEQIDHLFASIQTLNSREFMSKTTPDFYDFIIIDEFHHAAASSYQTLLEHYKPKVLLGLTATPERADGKSILKYFDDRIAAEIRLPEAIDRKLLCPFQYFGVADDVDLSHLKWNRGGYDVNELSNLYTFDQAVAKRRAQLIASSLDRYVADINEVIGLGFCVTKEHARFMADQFNSYGIPSMSLTSDSSPEERKTAASKLVHGELKFIFVVDIYNEGVDIPEVNTVLFLRPTESLTVFLQQLGRGLRMAEGKDCLTVLDFVGQANKRYNFEDKFAALLEPGRRSVATEVKNGFVSVPKGCYIQLERKVREHVLANISRSIGDRRWIVAHLETFAEDSGEELTLANFLNYHHLDPRVLYAKNDSFAQHMVAAGLIDPFDSPDKEALSKAMKRICAIDSWRWIKFIQDAFDRCESMTLSELSERELRMLEMFQITIWGANLKNAPYSDALECLRHVKQNTVLYQEIRELLQYNLEHIDFVDEEVDFGFECPLDLHCQYTRDQLYVALGIRDPGNVREGVRWLKDKRVDVLTNTLNKSSKDYSPTTMYKDYSINEHLFHWQSQSTTSADSPTGQRYIHHKEQGSKVLLFVREFNDDIAGTAPFTFLGLADYVSHEGDRPMSIVWELERPIPAKFIKKSNKLLAG